MADYTNTVKYYHGEKILSIFDNLIQEAEIKNREIKHFIVDSVLEKNLSILFKTVKPPGVIEFADCLVYSDREIYVTVEVYRDIPIRYESGLMYPVGARLY